MAGYSDVIVLRHPEPGAVGVSWSKEENRYKRLMISSFFRLLQLGAENRSSMQVMEQESTQPRLYSTFLPSERKLVL